MSDTSQERQPAADSYPAEPTWQLLLENSVYRLGFREGRLFHLGFASAESEDDGWPTALATRSALHTHWDSMHSEVYYTVGSSERGGDLRLGAVTGDSRNGSLTLSLQDDLVGIEIRLRYETFAELGLVRRHTSYVNVGTEPQRLTLASSFQARWPLGSIGTLQSLHGDWGDEYHVQETPLPVGTVRLETTTGKQFMNLPWFELVGDGGRWFGLLEYSGSWFTEFTRDITGGTTVRGGVTDRGFGYVLEPGEAFDAPAVVLGFTDQGAGAASRQLHRFQRMMAPKPDLEPPVVFDHYFPFHPGMPSEQRLRVLADKAASIGCEVFLLDAGWHHNVDSPSPDLWPENRGDWIETPGLFEAGLSSFAEYVRSTGMSFGIWLEPETVSPTAKVYQERPEWVHSLRGEPIVGRNDSMLLRLGIPEVRDWVYEIVADKIRTYGATWLKWDFNTEIPLNSDGTGKDEGYKHIEGLYDVWNRLRAAFPDVVLENCASGGGRMDLGAVLHSDVTCLTDRMTPTAALGIHFGAFRAFRPGIAMNWLVHWPADWQWMRPDDALTDWSPFVEAGFTTLHGDLGYRARVAMLGAFGISAPLDIWTEGDLHDLASHVAIYKQIRQVIATGDVYRLTDDPSRNGESDWAAIWYMNRAATGGVLFVFRMSGESIDQTFCLPELPGAASFTVRDVDSGEEGEESGAYLASTGIDAHLSAPFTSKIFLVERVEQ